MLFSGRWIYFSTIVNWNAPGAIDPSAALAFVTVLRQILQAVRAGPGNDGNYYFRRGST